MSADRRGERRAAGVICLRRGDLAMLVLRHSKGGHWGIPKGHRDADEASDIACALRETREEAGPAALTLIPGFREEVRYRVPAKSKREAYDKVVVHFLGWWPEGVEPTLSDEHEAWRWMERSELEALIPFENLRPTLIRAFEAGARAAEAS